jgi:ABC-2 type transport system ATP-binding protein
VLVVDDVSKRYLPPPRWLRPLVRTAASEPVEALRHASFSVAPGEIVGLVGPNGAGKTTLIKIIATLLEPTAGHVLIDGIDVSEQPLHARRRLGVVLADDRGLYWRLSGRQNLELFGVITGLPRSMARDRAVALMRRTGLHGRDRLVFGYSSGMRTQLSLARCLLGDPGLLVLDEPTRSLDPLASAEVATLLGELAEEGRAVLLSSHRLDEVASLCHQVVVVVDGTVRYIGTPADLGADGTDAAAALAALLAEEAAT